MVCSKVLPIWKISSFWDYVNVLLTLDWCQMYLPDSGIENLTKLKSLKTFVLWELSEIKVVETAEVLSKLPLLTKLCIGL